MACRSCFRAAAGTTVFDVRMTRYLPDELYGTFGEPFQLVETSFELLSNPSGSRQQFVYRSCPRVLA